MEEKDFRLVVAGSRNFTDYTVLKQHLQNYLNKYGHSLIIVSGNAKGADLLGERYARENQLRCEVYRANWSLYGNAAGPIRNKKMSEICDEVIVFWDEVSRGTSSMISCTKNLNKQIQIIKI